VEKKFLTSGKYLGPYEILSPLGKGGMGEVFRARDTKLGREVAIKILPAAFSSDPERLRRFEQEACAAAALNHPNTLTIFNIGNCRGSKYIVSELVEGQTVRERLGSGPLPLNDAIEYGIQLAHGLTAVHEKRIIHRDLKPENILISKTGKVKILDFGLAKQTHCEDIFGQGEEQITASGTKFGTIMGSSGYMSPEQVRGRQVDHRSDIFSFGAILYEMLAGRRAFAAESVIETMIAILNAQPPRIMQSRERNLSPELEGIVARCLEKDPDQRFQSANELSSNLESLAFVPVGNPMPLTATEQRNPLPCGSRRHSCCRRRGSSVSGLRRFPLSWRAMS
jgi:eukaryotic-like serine/threonine-protein kinase